MALPLLQNRWVGGVFLDSFIEQNPIDVAIVAEDWFAAGPATIIALAGIRLNTSTNRAVGAVWRRTGIRVGPQTQFLFKFILDVGLKRGTGGAGIALVLHGDPRGVEAAGHYGAALGYKEDLPPEPPYFAIRPSLAIGFDSISDYPEEPSPQSFAVFKDAPTDPAAALGQAEIPLPLLVDGGTRIFYVCYSALQKKLYIGEIPSGSDGPIIYLEQDYDFFASSPEYIYWGWTSSSYAGGNSNTHDITNRYTVAFEPGPLPLIQSATLPLLSASLTASATPPTPTTGSVNATLPLLSASLTASATPPTPTTGSVNATLPLLRAALSADATPPTPTTGSVNATLPLLRALLSADATPVLPGNVDAVFPLLHLGAEATTVSRGDFNLTLPLPVADIDAIRAQIAALNARFPVFGAKLFGKGVGLLRAVFPLPGLSLNATTTGGKVDIVNVDIRLPRLQAFLRSSGSVDAYGIALLPVFTAKLPDACFFNPQVGSPHANSYVSIEEADRIACQLALAEHDFWAGSIRSDKIRWLQEAAYQLNQMPWKGSRTSTLQRLAWPRTDVWYTELSNNGRCSNVDPNSIPCQVKRMQVLLAAAIGMSPDVYLKSVADKGADAAFSVKRAKVGPIEAEFFQSLSINPSAAIYKPFFKDLAGFLEVNAVNAWLGLFASSVAYK